MKSPASGYQVQVDKVGREEWSELLQQFEDATIYQTWSYGAVRWGQNHLSHLVLKKGEVAIGLAQSSVARLRILGAGIAYIPWGPVWRKKGVRQDLDDLNNMIRALRQEYVVRRGLLLRITPNEMESDDGFVDSILKAEGFEMKSKPYRTLLIDLSLSLEELRKGSARRWRRALKTAEEKELKIVAGTEDDLFKTLITLHKEMVDRKGFVPGVDINEFRAIQQDLPDPQKMKIMVCEFDGKPISALAASVLGNKGIGLVGGTATSALNLGAFHLLNWRMIEWMKTVGARYYDFGGYDPEANPGTAGFKDGLLGKDVYHIGQYEACESVISSSIVRTGQQLKTILRKTKLRLHKAVRCSPSKTSVETTP